MSLVLARVFLFPVQEERRQRDKAIICDGSLGIQLLSMHHSLTRIIALFCFELIHLSQCPLLQSFQSTQGLFNPKGHFSHVWSLTVHVGQCVGEAGYRRQQKKQAEPYAVDDMLVTKTATSGFSIHCGL